MNSSARWPNNEAATDLAVASPHWWYLPVLAILIGIAGLGAATALLMDGVEPFATWYYNFAWYPVLLFPLVTLAVLPGVIMERYYGSWPVLADSLRVLLLP